MEAGLKAVFVNNKVNILDKFGNIYMEGDRAGKTMYHLRIRSRVNVDTALIATEQQSSITLWHDRMGHLCKRNIRRIFNKELIDGIYLNNKGEYQQDDEGIQCIGCAKGKMSRKSFPNMKTNETSSIGERIHSDICGPMSQESLGGARFLATFKDEFSGRTSIYFMKQKSEVTYHFESFRTMLENQTGNKVKILRTDNGGEYTSDTFNKRLVELGIIHEKSAPYSPQQNGIAERQNRTLMEMARCMIYSSKSKLSPWIWGEATAYATYILNRTPPAKSEKSPFEVWTGRKPNLTHIRIFGSRTYVHIPDTKRSKLDAKCIEGILVGFCENTKAYRVYVPTQRKVIISRDVIIDETTGYQGETVDNTKTITGLGTDNVDDQFLHTNATDVVSYTYSKSYTAIIFTYYILRWTQWQNKSIDQWTDQRITTLP